MAQQLEPEKVDLSDIPEWIRQSHALVWRRGLFFFGLCLLYVVVSLLTRHMGYLTLPLGYITTLGFLVTFIVVAKASDDSLALSFAAVVELLRKLVLNIVILSVLISVVTVAAALLGAWLAPVLPDAVTAGAGSGPDSLSVLVLWTIPAVMRFFVVFLSIVVSGMWFLLPLLAFHSLSLLETALLSKKAERVNVAVMLMVAYTPMFAMIILLLLHDIGYLLTAVLVPYFGAIQYVSYRHVFTHKKKNSPARALSSALQSRTA